MAGAPLLAPAPQANLRCSLVVVIDLHHRATPVALHRYFHHYLYYLPKGHRVVVSYFLTQIIVNGYSL
jgi:hypothetical protein